jgi:shikimate kinase
VIPAAGGARSPWIRVVLVGFMGAGKSRVARETARLLGWDVLDVDQELERRSGRTIPTIFREDGEATFREMEASLTEELLQQERVVIATGGGWAAAAPDRMASLDDETLSVWLRIPAEEAVRRVSSGRGRSRPLLKVADPLAEARRLLELREPCYRQARLILEADRFPPRALARSIRDEILGVSSGN